MTEQDFKQKINRFNAILAHRSSETLLRLKRDNAVYFALKAAFRELHEDNDASGCHFWLIVMQHVARPQRRAA